MVTLYTDPRMLDHIPHDGHPEKPDRLRAVTKQLGRVGILDRCRLGVARPATDEELLRVHTPAHLRAIERAVGHGGEQVETDTWVSPGSGLAARLAAGSVVEAISTVLAGDDRRAFCAVRPPGHHARPADPMGFCLFGSVAVGAADALARHSLNRILIVDWDVHHGNGTQEMFYEDARVGFYSIHRYPFYPGTGAGDETGTGEGLGSTRNDPIAFGTSRTAYRSTFREGLAAMADRMRPELILLSAGFDAHAEDPIGNLGLEVEDFEAMTREVIEVAEAHAGGRLVSVLEGGYNISILAGCVASHVEALLR